MPAQPIDHSNNVKLPSSDLIPEVGSRVIPRRKRAWAIIAGAFFANCKMKC